MSNNNQNNPKKLILASGSPRRKMFFELMGLDFEQIPSTYEEDITLDMKPEDLVCFLSEEKGKEVATREEGLIVSCDTMVFCDGKALGKPKDKEDCINMFKYLSGKSHYVISGVTIIDTKSGKKETKYEKTEVRFRELSNQEIESYAETDEPYDKAGGYAIQSKGATFIEYTKGCYTNIVGLPIPLFLRVMKEF